ncbi:MAG TPA: glucose 1-dehydrogenase [Bacillota bacterium]
MNDRGRPLAGRVALVTGGGTGIGRAIALRLAAMGAGVVLVGRRRELLEEAAAQVTERGGRAWVQPANVRDPEQLERVAAFIRGELGALHVLVNNAGGQFVAPTAQITPNGWRAVIDLNLNAIFDCCRVFGPLIAASGGGSIVNMAAAIYQRGSPGMAHSAAARAAVVNLTQTLAVEWAGQGIRVNAVAPGLTDTEAFRSNYDPATLARLEASVPLGRMGRPEEVAAAVAFLVSPEAAYITGQTLTIDGGLSLRRMLEFV